ncbi:hypothetical protein PRO82_002185 [Candidatus Protochlamydia amoebophila]|nr:hypothetical protein [Candidatus Protochlamydia amoebophila]
MQLCLAFRFACGLYDPTAYERIFFFKIEVSHLRTYHENFKGLKKMLEIIQNQNNKTDD